MSLWGYTDNVAIAGTVSAYTQNVNVVGSSTYFSVNVKDGDYLFISGKKYQVANVTSNTALYLTNVASANIAGATAYLQQGPKFLANIVQMGGDNTDRQNNVATIQNVYGATLNEMYSNVANTTVISSAGAGYYANVVSNTWANVYTTGASQPTNNANVSLTFTNEALSSITITVPGSGYNAAAAANTYLLIKTNGSIQPTSNATANILFTTGGNSTQFQNSSHQGWVTYIAYTDALGQKREKSEVLVAMSKNFTAGTAGDASDDTIFPDS